MKLYKIGEVISIGKNYIIFESNNNGVIINVNYPNNFEKRKELKLFVYEYKNDYVFAIYGFRFFNERVIFEDLLSVSGIGPKTAMNIVAKGFKKIINSIINKDTTLLTLIKSVGDSTASQIIYELRPKYVKMQGIKEGKVIPYEISSTLKKLGFSKNQISFAMTKLEPSDNFENMVEKAIFIISNEYKSSSTKL